MELRMYGLVNYQLTGIQQGIQFLHGVVEYGQMAKELGGTILTQYDEWANKHKTVILLNGGTTNKNPNNLGTLNKHLVTLKENGIFCSEFYEPDLGDQLTGVVFLVEEEVFLKDEKGKFVYLEFEDWIFNHPKLPSEYTKLTFKNPKELCKNSTNPFYKNFYIEWVEYMGGEKNVFLREFLKNFRLA
jgi:hypothetical protein